jgi:hypothetical protein
MIASRLGRDKTGLICGERHAGQPGASVVASSLWISDPLQLRPAAQAKPAAQPKWKYAIQPGDAEKRLVFTARQVQSGRRTRGSGNMPMRRAALLRWSKGFAGTPNPGAAIPMLERKAENLHPSPKGISNDW